MVVVLVGALNVSSVSSSRRRDREPQRALARTEPREIALGDESAGSIWDPPSSCYSGRARLGSLRPPAASRCAWGKRSAPSRRTLIARGLRPRASLAALRRRAEILERDPRVLRRRGVLEVETPALSPAGVPDLALESIAANARSLGPHRTTCRRRPSIAMKRLLAAGSATSINSAASIATTSSAAGISRSSRCSSGIASVGTSSG